VDRTQSEQQIQMEKKQQVTHLLYGGNGMINYYVGKFDEVNYFNVEWFSHKSFPTDFDFTCALPEQDLEFVVSDFYDNRETKFEFHLRGLIEYILLQPLEIRKELEKEIIDNINELHHQNNF
jgi:hypothetical protein